jgi:hypothetical protein
MEAARIAAEAGASIWVTPSKYERDSDVSFSGQGETIDIYINMLKKEGLYGIVNGFFWDEPIQSGYKNQDFLDYTEYLYKKYGLRNYALLDGDEYGPVIRGGAKGYETYSIEEYDANYQIYPAALRYITDIGCKVYAVDVRDGLVYSDSTIRYWQECVPSKDVVDGKSYYTESAKYVKKLINHKANYWYFSPCYETYIYQTKIMTSNEQPKSDEDYCIAHLEFMKELLAKEENAGGIALYGYRGKNYYGLSLHNDIVDENGEYMFKVEQFKKIEKYPKYCKLLRDTTVKFNSTKPTLVKLDV